MLHQEASERNSRERLHHPLGKSVADAAPGILRLAQNEQCRALVFIDGAETFGSQLRRNILRLLPHFADLGFNKLILDIPEEENSLLFDSLERGTPLEYYLGRARGVNSDISPEWTAILSLAHSLSIEIIGGATAVEESSAYRSLCAEGSKESSNCLATLSTSKNSDSLVREFAEELGCEFCKMHCSIESFAVGKTD